MVYIKTPEEIALIREGGKILSDILKKLIAEVKPGVTTGYLEELACAMALEAGAKPAFMGYDMGDGLTFPTMLCTSINEEVVHGPALPSRRLDSGDIIDIDLGIEYPMAFPGAVRNPHSKQGGFFTDMCATVGVGKISREAEKLIRVTRRCLDLALAQVKPGKTLNDIGRAVEECAEAAGYGVVRDLVGHGVGYYAHEEPDVFNYVINPKSPENLVLKPGMVIAIEPMINAGTWRVKTAKNGYTVVTADGSLSAHFEHTVAVTDSGCEILTRP
jgi:methionyl aminopeptidase